MNETAANTVKSLLPKLNARELKEVSILATELRNRKGLMGMRAEDELFFYSLSEVLSDRLSIRLPSLMVMKKTSRSAYNKFYEVLDYINEWTDNVMAPHRVTRSLRRKLYLIFTDLVADEVQRLGLPLAFTTLVQQYENLPGIVDQAYPGYAQAGMLHILLTASPEQDADMAA